MRHFFHSKMAVNLTVICPFALASALLLGIKMEVSLTQGVLLCVVPTIYACFISVLGMYMNVKFPKYDWTSEYYAVKGGAISVLATLGVGMLSSVIPLFICIAAYKHRGAIMLVTSVLLLAISFALYSPPPLLFGDHNESKKAFISTLFLTGRRN